MTSDRPRNEQSDEVQPADSPELTGQGEERERRTDWLVGGVLILLLLLVYGLTMHPGLASSDAAELQYMSPMLGVLHSPGYPLVVLTGKLFSLLPFGSSMAWRINLMQVICGTAGCLCFFGIVRRLTQQTWPAVIATATYAFSVVVWRFSTTAEVYAFYNLLLLGGVYAVVRFVTGGRTAWLYIAAALLGMCVGNRLSELFVMPGVLLLWFAYRRQAPLRWRQVGLCALIGVLPFLFSVGYCFMRDTPNALHARDDVLRDHILGLGPSRGELPFGERLAAAFSYCTGGMAHEDFTQFSCAQMRWDLNKYAWRTSGLGALGERYSEEDFVADPLTVYRQMQQGEGTSVGVLGVLLALFGLRALRRRPGVVLLGTAFFVGNLAFFIYMHPADNLTFTAPSVIGLSVLIGLGVAYRPDRQPSRAFRIFQATCVVVPLFLLVTNWGPICAAQTHEVEHMDDVASVQIPQNSVIIARYPRANRLRYLYWVIERRRDIRVFIFRRTYTSEDLQRLVIWARDDGRTAIISGEVIDDRAIEVLGERTPDEMRAVGFYYGVGPPAP